MKKKLTPNYLEREKFSKYLLLMSLYQLQLPLQTWLCLNYFGHFNLDYNKLNKL